MTMRARRAILMQGDHKVKDRIMLFLKGMCMGIADVIPGVSGGTLALILGIYKEFVDTLRGLHVRWLPVAWRWLKGGRKAEDFAALKAELITLNLPFLITLVSGIATAIVVGSTFIPYLIENHPVPTRAFFFGLILASVYVPVRMIRAQNKGAGALAAAVIMALVGAGFGYWVTNPSNGYEGAREEFTLTAQGETLKDLARRGPTSQTLEQIYWSEQNAALREQVTASTPDMAKELEALRESAGAEVMDKKALKARSVPYEEVMVPAKTPVVLVRPALWFIAIAGAIAICAMILPGISGSYILLIFGVYFFILNALKGTLSLLASGSIPTMHIVYLGVFISAMVVGILSFARLLSYLLDTHLAPTLGVLVGLMLGCLRGIWPFQASLEGVVSNVLPTAETASVGQAGVALLTGVVIVVLLTMVGARTERAAQDDSSKGDTHGTV